MNANTHTAVGLATASGVALVAPSIYNNDLFTLGLGLGVSVIGALLPDIDANGESKAKRDFRTVMTYLTIFIAGVVVFSVYNGSLNSLILSALGSSKILGWIGFLICCLVGYFSHHRTFTHWLIGLVCFTVTFTVATDVYMGTFFCLGFLSHQFIDMLNKRKITWLYPLPIDFARYICYASSRMSSMVRWIASVLTVVFLTLILSGVVL